MKKIFTTRTSSKDASRAETQKGPQKAAPRQMAGATKASVVTQGKPPKKDGDKPRNPGPKGPKTVRNAQSAVRPGNSSGLTNKKGNPEIQFGPLLREFLFSREMVGQGLSVEYRRETDEYNITVSFKQVLENGVSTSELKTLKFEEYLALRKGLLKVKDESTHFMDFTSKLLERLGMDITKVKPSVSFKSVETFVLKHLSPVEKAILALTSDEYDRVDTDKIPMILRPTEQVVEEVYGGKDQRAVSLVKLINTEGPVTDIPPPNWVAKGITGMSKGTLLEAIKLTQAPSLSEEQRATLEAMKMSLFGEAPLQGEESKSED